MKYLITILLYLLLVSCGQTDNSVKKEEKELILTADREAPLGWIYLRMYDDKTFEFESKGLERKGTIYSGKYNLKNDTIIFNYTDSIPRAGNMALIGDKVVAYINGEYPERVEIKINRIK